MYAVRVQINDGPVVTGGASDLSVLSAILTLCGKLGPTSHPLRGDEDEPPDFTFRLGGLTAREKGNDDEHLVWLEENSLRLGDKLTLEIVETNQADPVESGTKAEERSNDERSYYEHCKHAYFEMKSKYEPE